MGGLNLQSFITLNSAGFEHGMKRVGESVADGVKGFALGAIGIGTVEQAISKTIDTAAELVNTAKNLSMTTDELQVMRKAAEENGKEFGVMANALERFNAVRQNILQGGKGSADQMAAMAHLGITPDALKNQTAAQSMMGQISTTARGSNAADIADDLKKVFGRGGDELFGTLRTDFDELGATMRASGEMMDELNAHQLKALKDQLDKLSNVLTAAAAPALVALGKVVLYVNAALGAFGTGLGTWAGEIADMISHPIEFIKKGGLQGLAKDALGGGEAGAEAKNFWDKQMEAIGQLDKKPEHPQPQKTDLGDDEKKKAKLPHEHHQREADAMVRVGNFLGTNIGATASRASNKHAEETAKNTRLTVDALYALNKNLFRGAGLQLTDQQRAQKFGDLHNIPTN